MAQRTRPCGGRGATTGAGPLGQRCRTALDARDLEPWMACLRDCPPVARPCFLCGLGEQSGQHLVAWCPVVAAVWQDFDPPHGLCHAVTHPGEWAPSVRTLLHQANFLHAALSTQGTRPGASRAWGMLHRLVRTRANHMGSQELEEDECALEGDIGQARTPEQELQPVDMWTVSRPQCEECRGHARRRPQISATTERARTGANPGDRLSWRPIWRPGAGPHTSLGTVYCS